MNDVNCIFCKIVNGEIPSATIYEDEHFRVILDLMPASKGHALIIPKSHFRNLFDLEEHLAAQILVLAKNIMSRMKAALGCEGFNLVQNNEAVAGQTVFHFHMHLIPRYEGDNAGVRWNSRKLEDKDKEEILDKLSGL